VVVVTGVIAIAVMTVINAVMSAAGPRSPVVALPGAEALVAFE
jgi:hypothetical protein